MIEVGALIGHYRLIEKLGSGAMGEVWLGLHPTLGTRVAVKVIHRELAANEEMLARFFNEARAVAQIGHPNVVGVQDFGQAPDGESFIVMELLEGVSLGATLAQQGALPIPRAVHIALQLVDGLAAAHARGIVHRDLKPDNIFLLHRDGDPDFVKLIDFGLAKVSGPSRGVQHRTKTGSLLGTPHYMAPEQAENVKTVDHRADIYSLGCILFQMVTGQVPFAGKGFGEVLVRHLREPPPLPSRLNPAVPPALERIILHTLAKRPGFRFSTMIELGQALRHPECFELATPLSPSSPAPTEELPIGSLRPRRAGLWLFATLLLGLGGAVWRWASVEAEPLTIESEPAGAAVFEGAHLLGTTPLATRLAAGHHTLVVQKAGFVSAQRPIAVPAAGAVRVRLVAEPRLAPAR